MKRLSRLLLACPIISVHVMHLMNVVIDAYRMPRISLFYQQHHRVVDDIVTPSEETDVDRSLHIEFVAIARLLQVHHHLLFRLGDPSGTAREGAAPCDRSAPGRIREPATCGLEGVLSAARFERLA